MRTAFKIVTIATGLAIASAGRANLRDNQVVTIKAIGDGKHNNHSYLDGNTKDKKLTLIGSADDKVPGTKWKVRFNSDDTVGFYNTGDGANGGNGFFLEGRTDKGTVGVDKANPTTNFGTHWSVESIPGGYALRSKAVPNSKTFVYMDGHILDGAVGMAGNTQPSGTHWEIKDYAAPNAAPKVDKKADKKAAKDKKAADKTAAKDKKAADKAAGEKAANDKKAAEKAAADKAANDKKAAEKAAADKAAADKAAADKAANDKKAAEKAAADKAVADKAAADKAAATKAANDKSAADRKKLSQAMAEIRAERAKKAAEKKAAADKAAADKAAADKAAAEKATAAAAATPKDVNDMEVLKKTEDADTITIVLKKEK